MTKGGGAEQQTSGECFCIDELLYQRETVSASPSAAAAPASVSAFIRLCTGPGDRAQSKSLEDLVPNVIVCRSLNECIFFKIQAATSV